MASRETVTIKLSTMGDVPTGVHLHVAVLISRATTGALPLRRPRRQP